MMQLFKKTVATAVDVVTDTVEDMATLDTPIANIPAIPSEHVGSLEDINLPLLVRELGERKKQKLLKRMVELEREMEKAQKELAQLNVLLDAANSI
jgi:hypothetical protein